MTTYAYLGIASYKRESIEITTKKGDASKKQTCPTHLSWRIACMQFLCPFSVMFQAELEYDSDCRLLYHFIQRNIIIMYN